MLHNINGAMQRMVMCHIFAETQQTEVYTVILIWSVQLDLGIPGLINNQLNINS